MCTILINYVLKVKISYIFAKYNLMREIYFLEMGAEFLYFWPLILLCVVSSICLFIITALKITRYDKDTAHHLKDSESRLYDKNKKWSVLKHLCIIICNNLFLLMTYVIRTVCL